MEGELFVNGKSQGRVRKDKSSRLDRYRLRWNNVKYEPGEIRVVTYNQYGDKVGEDVKRTAGEPTQMKFSVETPDHEPIACMVEGCTDEHNVLLNADGNDLAFITVSLLDKDGNECPLADDELTFEVRVPEPSRQHATVMLHRSIPSLSHTCDSSLANSLLSFRAGTEGRHHPQRKGWQAQYRKVAYAAGNIRCSDLLSA